MSKEKSETKEAPDGTLQQGEFKIKSKPKKLTQKQETAKVDLTKKEEDANTEPSAVGIPTEEPTESVQEVEVPKPEVQQTEEKIEEKVEAKEEVTVINEVTDEKIVKEDKVEKPAEPTIKVPENIKKLLSFMEDTGGTLNDYVDLNKDYSKYDNEEILREYYKKTKPHLDSEEVGFLIEDNFAWDEDEESERDIRKKKVALKDEIAEAYNFLEDSKSKYYDEIKLRPGATKEQQKATDFFNRYNNEQTAQKEKYNRFTNGTDNFFKNDNFEGFDFNVGEKKFKYNINNSESVAQDQADLGNFVKKFLDKNGEITDYKKYHKALYAANNTDKLVNHFYEQGKADAVKEMSAKSKNITLDERPTNNGSVFVNGIKVRAISGVDSSKLKIKTKQK
jgi:hypothetical protein